ncbi:hypothetical protein MYX84_01935, partial [Acidobacteria bacterium AH-259-O06]|nr:hypothetical protein [Acidobacteria bacterium AH-259-O06]
MRVAAAGVSRRVVRTDCVRDFPQKLYDQNVGVGRWSTRTERALSPARAARRPAPTRTSQRLTALQLR